MIRSFDDHASPRAKPRGEAWRQLVARVLDLRASGCSIRAIVDHLSDDGVATSRSTVHRILAANPRPRRADAPTVRIADLPRSARKPRSSSLDRLGAHIAALYAAGATTGQIRTWLADEHGMTRSASAVTAWIRRNETVVFAVPDGFDAADVIDRFSTPERPRSWRTSAISNANLDVWVLDLRDAGYTYAQIQALCREEAGVRISTSAIRKWIANHPRGPRVEAGG